MTHSTFRPNRSAAALTVFGLGTAALGPAVHAQIEFHVLRQFDGPYRTVTIADFNSDGHVDAAVATPHGVEIFLNDGQGALVHVTTLLDGVAAWHMAAGDIDGDGNIDLVVLQPIDIAHWRFHFFYNDGDGRSGEVQSHDPPRGWIQHLAIGDLAGDGRAEVVYGLSRDGLDPELRVIRQRERGEFVDRLLYRHPSGNTDGPWVRSVALGDLDGDGDLDVVGLFVYAHGSSPTLSNVAVLRNRGRRAWDKQVIGLRHWMDANFPVSLAIGDIDGDGDFDLIIAGTLNSEGGYYKEPGRTQFGILVNDGTGVFHHGPVIDITPQRGGGRGLALSDLDTDGRLDVITSTFEDNQGAFHVTRNAGGLTFDPPIDIDLDAGSVENLAVGDFDGDGLSDLLLTILITRPTDYRMGCSPKFWRFGGCGR